MTETDPVRPSRRSTDAARRSVAPVTWAAATGVTLLAVVAYVTASGAWAEAIFQVVSWSSLAVFAAGLRRRRSVEPAWVLVGIGFVLFAIGDLLFTLNEYLFEVETFPSTADVAYLAGYPVLAIGLAVLARSATRSGGHSALIDAGIVVTPLTLAGWLYIVEPFATDADLTMLERAVSAAYPVGDLLCLAVLVRFLAGLSGRSHTGRLAVGLLIASLGSLLLGDVVFLSVTLSDSYVSGGLTDGIYLGSYVFLAATALSPAVAEVGHAPAAAHVELSRRRLGLLAVAALVAPAMLALQWLRGDELTVPLVVGGTVLTFLLVVARMSGLVHDLEASRRQLAFEATHDALTGLANRQLFGETLERSLRTGAPGGLLFVDLDRFKLVNDTLGHHVGDEVLVEVASILRASVRDRDVVGRLAGDEFVVLIGSGDRTELLLIAERIVTNLRVSRRGADHEITVTASVGLVRWDPDTSPDDAKSLMRAADAAMYGAKQANGNQLVIASV